MGIAMNRPTATMITRSMRNAKNRRIQCSCNAALRQIKSKAVGMGPIRRRRYLSVPLKRMGKTSGPRSRSRLGVRGGLGRDLFLDPRGTPQEFVRDFLRRVHGLPRLVDHNAGLTRGFRIDFEDHGRSDSDSTGLEGRLEGRAQVHHLPVGW